MCTYYFDKTRDPELRSLKLTLDSQLRCGFCSMVLGSSILPSQHPGGSKIYSVKENVGSKTKRDVEVVSGDL